MWSGVTRTGIWVAGLALLLAASAAAGQTQEQVPSAPQSGPPRLNLDPPAVVKARGLPNPPRTECERALQSEPFTNFDETLNRLGGRADDLFGELLKANGCTPKEIDNYLLSLGARRHRVNEYSFRAAILYNYEKPTKSWLQWLFGLRIVVFFDGRLRPHGMMISVRK